MNLGYLAYRNMVSKPLNLILSLMLLSLSVSLVTFVLQLNQQLSDQLSKNIAPFDMVVGAKGSPLQLVLSSVLHIDNPTGNIKLKDVKGLRRHPFVKKSIPVSYGDSYKGYRILGTEIGYLESYGTKVVEGRPFQASFEVVVGSGVRDKLNLKLGATFISSHGLLETATNGHEDHPFTVVGFLAPTGSVIDQLLICNLESIWEVHDHGEDRTETLEETEHIRGHTHDGEHDHREHQQENLEITSLLVKFKSPLGMVQLPRFINQNTSVQAALPGFEVQRLIGLLGSGGQAINGIALAILLVSGLSIFISLLKTIRERRQELALLRTYGFPTRKLLALALLEGLFLAGIGFSIGWLLGRLGIWLVSGHLSSTYGYSLQLSGPEIMEFYIMAIIAVLAVVATLLASLSIFKLNVAKTLSDD